MVEAKPIIRIDALASIRILAEDDAQVSGRQRTGGNLHIEGERIGRLTIEGNTVDEFFVVTVYLNAFITCEVRRPQFTLLEGNVGQLDVRSSVLCNKTDLSISKGGDVGRLHLRVSAGIAQNHLYEVTIDVIGDLVFFNDILNVVGGIFSEDNRAVYQRIILAVRPAVAVDSGTGANLIETKPIVRIDTLGSIRILTEDDAQVSGR